MPSVLASCPDCRSADSVIVSSEGLPFDQPEAPPSFHQPAYHIHECRQCGLLFRSPTLSDDELADYYASLSSDHWEYPDIPPPEHLISDLLAQLPPNSSILDFGCSSGRLLSPWTRHHRCFGFEINEHAAATAASRGITMVLDPTALIDLPSFDAIILVDVFEHLRHPSAVLQALWKRLNPGGQLILSTGNGDHWACRLDPAQFWYFRNLEHLCMLTRGYAITLADQLGGKVGRWDTVSHYNDPFKTRLFLHTAHTLYWALTNIPPAFRILMSRIPLLGKVAAWENAPHYACCRDHILCSIIRTSAPA